MEKEKYFKVGQKVYSLKYGEGVVKSINDKYENRLFPVKVLFENQQFIISYTFDGRFFPDCNIDISQTPLTIKKKNLQ